MKNNIIIEESLLRNLVDMESRKICGIIMKRYEIIEDKEILKKETKELIYEAYRNLRDMIILYGKESIRLSPSKELKNERE
jgi:hypothetical protein